MTSTPRSSKLDSAVAQKRVPFVPAGRATPRKTMMERNKESQDKYWEEELKKRVKNQKDKRDIVHERITLHDFYA